LIETRGSTPPLAALARRARLSPSHFHRTFKALTGVTPSGYAQALRADRVREELGRRGSVTEAIFQSGFNSSARFYASANDTLGMTARTYRHGGSDMGIRFAVGECTLGSVLVAQSARGVCAILLGDDPDALVRDLQDRFPRATFIGGDARFEHTIALVVGLVDTPSRGIDLPLDVRGTAFQRRVWEALRKVPVGTTLSYADLARRIGAPGSARAVARACAANPLAVAIPCHRVVRGDGGLSGYRWGVARKRKLLDAERTGG
jgi:AraC family transcriptional regulator of adaptative response/methylated-DNA-[protein]-cysteine methyltransferase